MITNYKCILHINLDLSFKYSKYDKKKYQEYLQVFWMVQQSSVQVLHLLIVVICIKFTLTKLSLTKLSLTKLYNSYSKIKTFYGKLKILVKSNVRIQCNSIIILGKLFYWGKHIIIRKNDQKCLKSHSPFQITSWYSAI